MNNKSSHSLNSPPPTLAVAAIVAKRLLVTEKSTAGNADGSSMDNTSLRATQVTGVLRKLEGYSHHGINE